MARTGDYRPPDQKRIPTKQRTEVRINPTRSKVGLRKFANPSSIIRPPKTMPPAVRMVSQQRVSNTGRTTKRLPGMMVTGVPPTGGGGGNG